MGARLEKYCINLAPESGRKLSKIFLLLNRVVVGNYTGQIFIEFKDGEIERWDTKLRNISKEDLK